MGADPAAVAEAELMFKLDFFEYYMLIERAVVHLLGVFGVEVPHGRGHEQYQDQQRQNGEVGGRGGDKKGLAKSVWRQRSEGRHRYHANVLAALDRAESPLHGTLGSGEVRVQLGRAKELRNRWKRAGEEDGDGDGDGQDGDARRAGRSPEREWRARKMGAPLDSYRLEYMLEVVFRGFDEAFQVAEAYVRGGLDWAEECDTDMLEVMDWAGAGDDEDQWEFMVEAMDWQAV